MRNVCTMNGISFIQIISYLSYQNCNFCMFTIIQYAASVFIVCFSAMTLLVGRQEEHPACKNLCFKTPWDIAMAVNGGAQPEVPCGYEEFWPLL